MKDPIKILTSCKNQVYTPHIGRVPCNLNNHVCIMLKRSLIHAKIKIIIKLKLVYILGFLLTEIPYRDFKFMQKSSMYTS